MFKHFLVAVICFALLICEKSFAQVSVDPLTGTGSVAIPIYTLNSGQVSVPVTLVYNGSGVKPKDVEGSAGMGWNVQAGGQVSRQVRGLPDDCFKDNSGSTRTGWMSTLFDPTDITNFTIANNGSTCSYETTDITYINGHFDYTKDTEPDLFYVSAPGLSCTLIYDRANAKFKPVSYEDLVISYTTFGGSGNSAYIITSFTITNDRGIKYLFSAPEYITQTTPGSTTPTYFKNKYLQYHNGIYYAQSWQLTSITDPAGNGVLLSYVTAPQTTGADSVALYIGGSTSYSLQYKTVNAITSKRLSQISTTNADYVSSYIAFNYTTLNGTGQTGQTVISSLTGTGKNTIFSYSPVNKTGSTFRRNFLRAVADTGCNTPISYSFSYKGEIKSLSDYTTVLPDSTSTQRDYWGYYSGITTSSSLMPRVWSAGTLAGNYQPYAIYQSNTGAVDAYPYSTSSGNIRAADSTTVATGSLVKITSADGGSSNIVYESNRYVDGPSGNIVLGGGIRVKQVIDSVGNGSTTAMIRNYSYVNPSTGVCSGKPVSLPSFAFTIPYSGSLTGTSLVDISTAVSAYDLSDDDHSIMYEYSKVSQAGAGSTVYQYYLPAMNWDYSAIPACTGCSTAEWYATTNYVARANCASTYGPIRNAIYSYPFSPNSNYDFERGLPLKVTAYNEDSTPKKVSETTYTYQRLATPSVINALRFDDNVNGTLSVKAYSKYKIYFNVGELTAKAINLVYDSLNVAQADTTIYTYGSSNHKLLTQVQKTNSDRSVLVSKTTYAKDYTAATSSGSNTFANAIYNLIQKNINVPVESYDQVTRAGVTKTTSASLTFFKSFTPGSTALYLPSKQYKMTQPDGLAGFVPLTISGQTVTYDSTHYYPVANYDVYDRSGYLVTADDNNKHFQTTITDHFADAPVAAFSNASYNEIAFSDFNNNQEYSLPHNFTINGAYVFSPTTAHAGAAFGLATSQSISHTVTKNTLASNYIFSIWINASTAGALTISLNGTPLSPSSPLNYTGGGTWKYYEKVIPVSSMGSTFAFSFTTSQQIGVDDILLYPEQTEVTTISYDDLHFKRAVTNTNGVSGYFDYDKWGRLKYAYDQDKNILQKNSYITSKNVKDYSNAVIAPSSTVFGSPNSFSVNGPDDVCTCEGATVTWNFGDGTATVTAGLLATVFHTFSSYGTNGIKPVTATINSPIFGSKSISGNVSVTLPPIQLSYASYTTSGGAVSSVTFTNTTTSAVYTFTGAQLNTATLPQGNYTIVVILSGGQHYNSGTGVGYNSVHLTGSCWEDCKTWVSNNTYTFTADLSTCTTLAIEISQFNTCGS